MLDYRGLEALYTIIQLQSFEAAAEELHITQSAVSQRLKALQNHYADPLLIRTLPYKPTKLGSDLIGHFKRIQTLEHDLQAQLKAHKHATKISIAISRDSLETWFMAILSQTNLFADKIVEIITDDQEITLEYLKQGMVQACFSTTATALTNCKVEFIGNFNYILVASPQFKKKYFADNNHRDNILNAPAIVFDANDRLHDRYLKKFFNIKQRHKNHHTIPSVQGFRQFANLGYAYALVPEIDVQKDIKEKKLVQLYKEHVWQMPVYLHYWHMDHKEHKGFFHDLIHALKCYFSHAHT